MAHEEYTPMARRLTLNQLGRACAEFQRLVELGHHDVRVTVATEMPAAHWDNSSVKMNCGKFEVTYSEDGTTVDLDLVDRLSQAHVRVVGAITKCAILWASLDIGNATSIYNRGFVDFHERNRVILRQVDGVVEPWTSTAPNDPKGSPRVIFDVMLRHRSLQPAMEMCQAYFNVLPLLQAVLLVKVNERQADRSIACLALLYLRQPVGARNPVVLSDAVSFGSAELGETQRDLVQRVRRIRRLVAPHQRIRMDSPSPWTQGSISIPAASILYATEFPAAAAQPQAFELDLWELFTTINREL